MSVDFCCASAMWSSERETPGAGLAGLGRVDRGEDLVWDILWWSGRSDDEGVEVDQNTWCPRWRQARMVAVSRAPGTTDGKHKGRDTAFNCTLCHQPLLSCRLQQSSSSLNKNYNTNIGEFFEANGPSECKKSPQSREIRPRAARAVRSSSDCPVLTHLGMMMGQRGPQVSPDRCGRSVCETVSDIHILSSNRHGNTQTSSKFCDGNRKSDGRVMPCLGYNSGRDQF